MAASFRSLCFCLVLASTSGCANQQAPAETPPTPPPASVHEPLLSISSSTPAAAAVDGAKSAAAIVVTDFGSFDQKPVKLFTLTNSAGLTMKVTNYGTIITELHVPDKSGKFADIVLGYDNLDSYLKSNPYFGATAGRIANRIKNAQFALEGKRYKLAANNGPHNLHGGVKGWDKVVWDAAPQETARGPEIKFSYVSKDGEEGFPGTVTATVTYTLTHQNELVVKMTATTDKTTIVNMAHHSYWNLAGFSSGPILDHELTIYADKFTPSAPVKGGDPVPDGTIQPVKGTPFDFTSPKAVGKDLKAVGGTPIGYDHNWIVNGEPGKLRPVAKIKDPKSGRVLTLDADQPGVQFYSGKFLDGSLTGKGARYVQYGGFCLETQKFPDAINVPKWRDQVILKPGATYQHTMVHRFSAE